MSQTQQSRREFLRIAGAGALASTLLEGGCLAESRSSGSARPAKTLFQLGMASYTLRKFDLDRTLDMTKRVGLKYIAFKSSHLPLDSSPAEIAEVAEKVKQAGLILYGGGVIYMKNAAEVDQAFDYAKAAGMKTIIGVPQPPLLPLVEKKVKQYDIKLAIHNHGPTDKVYPTPASAYERIKNLDPRIGLCNDIGHTQRAGVDPSRSIEKFADRLLDVHIKDVSESSARGQAVEVGRGVIDIPAVMKSLLKMKYAGIVAFEYEKDADDPLPGLAESVGYTRGVMAAL
jgi:inosose dehydratase